MTGRRSLWGTLLIAGSAACGGSRPDEIPTAEVLPACAPVSGRVEESETMAYMAGRYRLSLIQDGGRAQAFGVLDLEQTPDEFRDWGASVATLSGSASIDLTEAGAWTLEGLDRQDPAGPGVLVLEAPGSAGPSITLRFGSVANRRDNTPFDGAATALNILLIEGNRFAGSWQSSLGVERVEGYFCAERLQR